MEDYLTRPADATKPFNVQPKAQAGAMGVAQPEATPATIALAANGERRAVAVGFIVWGVTYLIVVWLVSRPHGDGPLATSWALWYLHGYIARDLPIETLTGGFGVVRRFFPDQDNFRLVGEIEWSWLLAVLGGFVTRALFRCWRQRTAGRSLDTLDA